MNIKSKIVLKALAATTLGLAAVFLASSPAWAQTAAKADFHAPGRAYEVDFGGGNAFEISFGADSNMTFKKLVDPGKGTVSTVRIAKQELRDGLYMVHWQEANKTTVVHVQDFAGGRVYANITFPDGQFFNGSSSLKKVK
ncbi:MAG TPA: hypothetical protein VLJ57_12575 [Burkholderiaceae bacterium]|nr:hypothetical protein [Burkholderiaceae bacterium]